MTNVVSSLLEFVGFSAPKRRPTARAKAPAPRKRSETVKATSANRSPAPRSKAAEPARPPEPKRRTLPQRPLPASSVKPKAKVAFTPPRRKSRPVGGLKMGLILALCIVGGTWIGSQVQVIAASPSNAKVSKDLAAFQPVSSTFTF